MIDPPEVFAANKGTWTIPIRVPKKKPTITESAWRRQLARLKALEAKQEKEALGYFPGPPAASDCGLSLEKPFSPPSSDLPVK